RFLFVPNDFPSMTCAYAACDHVVTRSRPSPGACWPGGLSAFPGGRPAGTPRPGTPDGLPPGSSVTGPRAGSPGRWHLGGAGEHVPRGVEQLELEDPAARRDGEGDVGPARHDDRLRRRDDPVGEGDVNPCGARVDQPGVTG